MSFWTAIIPVATALLARPKAPKPPQYEQLLGELAAGIYTQYVPMAAGELAKMAGITAQSPQLFTQRMLALAPRMRYQGQQALGRMLASRGLFNTPNVAGALAAYNAYATQGLLQQLGQAMLQDEQLRREAVARLAALATGTAQPALAVGQQMMTASSQAQAQEAALAAALAPLFVDIFIKRNPQPAQTVPPTLLPQW